MFLWPNKESIHVKQISDIINSIFGVFQNNLCFAGCPKKLKFSLFKPKRYNYLASGMNDPGANKEYLEQKWTSYVIIYIPGVSKFS